ncbi:VOC family protein [Ruegeria sp. 2205SS24-7]|uniref:VOC family protein n=1 Tax=Ruegeria discodermiae TaxID=3064389 RepID=UPI0027426822|nr:VOC family protein [Ruegeria sp. 2205SS24-7]MDP5217358.1 VOC family protein [Ruegeria sp. 2205SS24-7]
MTMNSGFGSIRSLDYVIILCDDLETMQSFYEGLFGFQVEEDMPGKMVIFRVGTLYLGLRRRGRPYDGPSVPAACASIQISFRVPPADVDIAYQSLLSRGIEVIEKPANQDWCHRTLFFRDPENNIVEVFADIHPRETLPSPSGAHELITP